jgi:hypothetical protein
VWSSFTVSMLPVCSAVLIEAQIVPVRQLCEVKQSNICEIKDACCTPADYTACKRPYVTSEDIMCEPLGFIVEHMADCQGETPKQV